MSALPHSGVDRRTPRVDRNGVGRIDTPLLEPGERLSQKEFHERYLQYPEHVKFELIGGIVYMASPARWPHGNFDSKLGFCLELYECATAGVEVAGNVTVILGDDEEPQPDRAMIILPEFGGQTYIDDGGYCTGAPELIGETAYSSRSIDLGPKKRDYEKRGVVEYIVFCVEDREFFWFHFPTKTQIRPGRDGIAKSKVFPGLWINVPALKARQSKKLAETVREGTSTAAHARFVQRLARTARKLKG